MTELLPAASGGLAFWISQVDDNESTLASNRRVCGGGGGYCSCPTRNDRRQTESSSLPSGYKSLCGQSVEEEEEEEEEEERRAERIESPRPTE